MRNKVLQFVFALLLSALLWFSLKLTEDYYTTLEVPVQYQELPERSLLAEPLPDVLTLRLRGKGHQLILPALFGPRDSLRLDGPELLDRSRLATRELAGRVQSLLPSEIEIQRIGPDSLRAYLVARLERHVPIVSDLKWQLPAGYFITKGPEFSPDSARVIGPAETVSGLRVWPTAPVKVDEVSEGSHSVMLKLDESDTLAVLPKYVKAEYRLTRFTEMERKVRIELLNLPLDERVRLLPAEVTLKYLVPFNTYERYQGQNLRVVVDMREVAPNQRLLYPEIRDLPKAFAGCA